MFSARSLIFVLAVLVAIICVAQCRNIQYDANEFNPEEYRYAQWAEVPHKRVPSAGDMMVRFGKRSM